MLKVVVLGSGGGIPTRERNLCSVGIRHFGEVYLFDCSEGTQRQMMSFKLSYMKVSAIFLSHLHTDHVLGIPGLLDTMELMKRKEPLLIYGPPGTKDLLKGLLTGCSSSFPIKIYELQAGQKKPGLELEVQSFKTNHRGLSLGYIIQEPITFNFNKEKAFGFGIKGKMFKTLEQEKLLVVNGKAVHLKDITYEKQGKKIVYSGDTRPCPETIAAAKNADLLIHDGMFISEIEDEAKKRGHSTTAQAAQVAKKAKAKQLLLVHISSRYDKEDEEKLLAEAKKIFPNTVLAKDGLTLEI